MSDELTKTAQAFLRHASTVLQVAKRTETVLRQRLGTAFQIAEYAVGGYEVPLNRIIGALLDPSGSHGQADLFLKTFLDQANQAKLGVPISELQEWRVKVNFLTKKGGLVDIALFDPTQIAIYIESKPWANEGKEQLERYAHDLRGLECEHQRLVFLPGTADRKPETLPLEEWEQLDKNAGEGNKGFISIPFQYSKENPSIVRWLERCAAACEADNVRIFVNDLAKYLRTQFPSLETRSMSDDPFASTMIPSVRNNKSYMDIVFRLEEMAPELRRTVAKSFLDELSHELENANPGWETKNHYNNVDREFAALTFRKSSWPRDWAVCLEAQKKFGDFRIGFGWTSEPNTPSATDDDRKNIWTALETPLTNIGGRALKNKSWPAFCKLPDPYQNWTGETFLRLADREDRSALDTFVDWFQRLAYAVEGTVDKIRMKRAQGASP